MSPHGPKTDQALTFTPDHLKQWPAS